MNGQWRKRWASRLSPWGLILRAFLAVLPLLVCHLAGWRQLTGVLSGTVPTGGSPVAGAVGGLLYALSYLLALVLAPILALGAGIWGLLSVWLGEKNLVEDVADVYPERAYSK